MRRAFGILMIALLSLAPALPGQTRTECRKRILVYLDVSGSMQPTSSGPVSPFQQTLTAIESLLNEPGFIGESDVLEVFRFGKTLQKGQDATGREAMLALLAMLRTNPVRDLETDFRPVFDSLAERLKDSGSFSSQVVLIGSDLVHEPRDGMPADEAIADWAGAWAAKGASRAEIGTGSTRTAFILFTPPALPRLRSVQERVAEDLLGELRRAEQVIPGQGDRTLADELTTGLLQPPLLTISRDAGSSSQLTFIVSNPNCVQLQVTGLALHRVLADGSLSTPFPYAVEGPEAALGGTGTAEATRRYVRPLPTGSGWEDLSRLKGTVETREKVTGTSEGTAGGWLKFRPVQGVVEEWLLAGPVLRLDLDVIGHSSLDSTYLLTVRSLSGDAEALPLARARFGSPADLDPVTPLRTRLVVSASRSLAAALAEPKGFRVEIQNAELIEGGQDGVEIAKDTAAGRSNLFLILAGLISLIAVAVSWLRIRSVADRFPALQPFELKVLPWLGLSFAASLPLLANLFHVRLLRLISPQAVDTTAVALSIVVMYFILAVAIKIFQTTMFGLQVVTSEKPLELEKYLKTSRRAGWMPWLIAGLLTLSFAASWFLVRPAVSERLARGEHPIHLRPISE